MDAGIGLRALAADRQTAQVADASTELNLLIGGRADWIWKYQADQYDNLANSAAHYETTGREVIDQTGGDIDAFVAGLGTTGTLMGAGRRQ